MSSESGPPTEKLVEVYIKMRDQRAKLSAEFDAADAAIEKQMKTIELMLLDTCKSAGASSMNTSAGTVIRRVKTHYWPSDWGSMHKFIKENNALELLERRVSQKSMAKFLAANPDKMPIGLNVESKYTIVVRRS